jgi:hypothetical protein
MKMNLYLFRIFDLSLRSKKVLIDLGHEIFTAEGEIKSCVWF